MPGLNFTKFTDKILSGEKRQTIRQPRKHPIKIGDRLYLYTHQRTKACKKLGEAVCSEVVPIKIVICFVHVEIWLKLSEFPWVERLSGKEINDIAKTDGFNSSMKMIDWFLKTCKLKPGDNKDFNIIKWRDFVPAGEG
jgi:hypothetical protein